MCTVGIDILVIFQERLGGGYNLLSMRSLKEYSSMKNIYIYFTHRHIILNLHDILFLCNTQGAFFSKQLFSIFSKFESFFFLIDITIL